MTRVIRWAACGVAAGLGVAAAAGPAGAADNLTFEKDIQPIVKQSCIKCHSLDNPRHKAASGLRLDSLKNALKGGDDGKDVVPGHADESLMYKLLLGKVTTPDGDDVAPMPKARRGQKFKPLPKHEIETIKKWINEGAH